MKHWPLFISHTHTQDDITDKAHLATLAILRHMLQEIFQLDHSILPATSHLTVSRKPRVYLLKYTIQLKLKVYNKAEPLVYNMAETLSLQYD